MSLDGEKDSKNSSMVDINSIIEGTVKFRDGKKWKSRWCVMRKLSPVADCLHLQFYKDSKERYKNGPTKASLSLEHFLGIESGFTLDKESNTIAILCQDVIVILAFDTREILMQWQVKISCNLGDDIQYLVLVASAATKIKIPPGPARLHIQNHRFCITTGIPPRLSGLWSLAHLRRYGVVDNRFCFEGGSSSGKCEGFVVLITDYGDEISNCFKLASQGKLNSNNRYTKPIDSPRKMKDNQSMKCDCSSSFWPSQESRGLESYIGCDSSSILDDIDSNDEVSHFSRKRLMAMERCMSCSSKRSLVPTMSRSSTITESNQEICFGSSSYRSTTSIDTHHQRICGSKPTLDRISMKSQESCGNFSEYSIPRQFPFHPGHSHEASSVRSFSVPRHEPTKSFVGSYDNYDSPKILSPSNENQMENYDKPKSVKMYLEQNAGGRHTIFNGDHGNYDMPNIHCCANGQNRLMNDDMKTDCTCHRVMSWADNWMPCRRGTGIENTGIPVSRPNTPTPTSQKIIAQEPAKCKLNDFSNTDKNGLYALVDPAKKQPKRLNEEQSITASFPRAQSQTPNANYANLEFANSLEIYENSREVLKREKALTSNENNNKICSNGNAKENLLNHNKENENYLVMDVNERSKTFPGYISMHPKNSVKPMTPVVVEEQIEEVVVLPPRPNNKLISSKILLNLDEKSHSNPDLNRPSLNLDEKHEASSTTKLVFKKSSSVDSFRFIDNESPTIVEDETSTSTSTYQDTTKADSIIKKTKPNEHIKVVNVRYADNGSKQPNRDSSSSNDSGVSTASTIIPKHYNEFELPLINQIKKRRQLNQTKSCVHASLIRRSKSFDPFGDLSFQFATRKAFGNGHSNVQNKAGKCPSLGAIMTSHIDSNSTSSGTSDMSDYIETLSLSSSSSDAEALKNKNNGTHMINTMRPRSGKEYEKIDRSTISGLVQASSHINSISPISSSTTSSSNPNYVNITPVPENSESPSPGYQSSSSFQEEYAVIKEPDVVVE
ncbi:hypothetical protein ACKWTF_011463 [Chironomus riparius]